MHEQITVVHTPVVEEQDVAVNTRLIAANAILRIQLLVDARWWCVWWCAAYMVLLLVRSAFGFYC